MSKLSAKFHFWVNYSIKVHLPLLCEILHDVHEILQTFAKHLAIVTTPLLQLFTSQGSPSILVLK